MMRIVILLIVFCSTMNLKSWSQREANTWYFGQLAGLSFETFPPQAIFTGGIVSEEGCASISDNQGRLLFYSGGTTILNRAHQAMKNGTGLTGDQSSTQGVLIVPQPGNDSLYYVFTNGAVHMLLENGLKYSIVNIKGDNGMGEVILKNTGLLTETYERIAAVRHCNNRDVWIVVRKWESDQYYAYLLTASGINNTPVISSTGNIVGGDINNNIGGIKFSSKGTKMACALGYGFDRVELLDFNRQTGQFSNAIMFRSNITPPVAGFPGVYGVEFSPDNRYLYTNAFNDVFDSKLFQFDISISNAAAIEASRALIHTETSGSGAGNIQVGPDARLYVAYRGKSSISVIDRPDNPGAACQFMPDAINLDPSGQRRVSAGLPNFVQSYFDVESGSYDFYRTGNCTSLSVPFRMNYSTGMDSVRWNFGDGTRSAQINPTHTFSRTGFHDVTLTIFKQTCSGNSQLISKRIWIAETDQLLESGKSFCRPGNVELNTDIRDVNLTWSNGTINTSIIADEPGIYWLEVENNGCLMRDSTQVNVIPPPMISLGPDTSVCTLSPVVLNAGIDQVSYSWNTGSQDKTLPVTKPGTYSVTITTADGCTASDSVEVLSGDCGLFMPGAFTPNSDGLNDRFGPVDLIQSGYFALSVYNRFGQEVFRTNDPADKWDGNIKGKPAAAGVYIWILRYQQKNFLPQTLKGTVVLFR